MESNPELGRLAFLRQETLGNPLVDVRLYSCTVCEFICIVLMELPPHLTCPLCLDTARQENFKHNLLGLINQEKPRSIVDFRGFKHKMQGQKSWPLAEGPEIEPTTEE